MAVSKSSCARLTNLIYTTAATLFVISVNAEYLNRSSLNVNSCINIDSRTNGTTKPMHFTGDAENHSTFIAFNRRARVPVRPIYAYISKANEFKKPWPIKNLTYRIATYPSSMKRPLVDAEIKRAFEKWSEYSELVFTEIRSGKANIEINFLSRSYRGRLQISDGRGKTLAMTHYPMDGGDIEFDNENWTAYSNKGFNLFQAAVHEIGHALGLTHNTERDSVMFSRSREYDPTFELSLKDKLRIQALYGVRTKFPSLCDDRKIKMFKSGNKYYVFKKGFVWFLPHNRPEHPLHANSFWPGIESNIDAALAYNGHEFFFKGSRVWKYDGGKLCDRYPKYINQVFPGIPNDIDAILRLGGRAFFFKGDTFWRYNFKKQRVTLVARISELFEGIPDNLDTAVNRNGKIYFVKGDSYWKLDENFTVYKRPYPHSIRRWWFGCRNDTVRI